MDYRIKATGKLTTASVALSLLLLGCEGLTSPPSSATDEKKNENGPAAPAVAPEVAEELAPAPVPDARPVKPTHFLKREAQLVDKKKAMAENDQLIEVENRINADNYVSAVSQAYFAAGSQVKLAQLKHQVDLMHATNERYPTFEEFRDLLKQFDIKLSHLYEYQMYAYDEETGEISILEDRAYKKRIYEAAGRELPPGE